jgi:hypothetical protein
VTGSDVQREPEIERAAEPAAEPAQR